MPALPLETIGNIIDLALEDEPDEHHNQHLLQWFRVSHTWRAAAARRLYASIELDEERRQRPRLVALYRTLEHSPELMACVKQLSVHLVRVRRPDALCAQLFRLFSSGSSSSLAQVTLHGSLPSEPRPLFESLLKLDNLRVLRLEFDTLDGVAVFSSGASLVSLLAAHWPHIEEVKIASTVIWDRRACDVGPAPRWLFREEEHATRTTQLPLTTLDLTHAGTMYASDLAALRAISLRHLRCFRVRIDASEDEEATRAILMDCIGAWAASLEELELEPELKLGPQWIEVNDHHGEDDGHGEDDDHGEDGDHGEDDDHREEKDDHGEEKDDHGEEKWVGFSELVRTQLLKLKVLSTDSRFFALEALLAIPTLSSIHYTDQLDQMKPINVFAFSSKLGLHDKKSDHITPRYLPAVTSITLVSTSLDFYRTADLVCTHLAEVCKLRCISLRVTYRVIQIDREWPMIDQPVIK